MEKMPADRKLTVPSLTTRISQTLQFDKGNYAVSFDVVRRRGYSATSTPLSVTMDGATVFTLEATKITAAWAGCISPVFPVTACVHTLAFILGEGEGMDMIDNVALKYRK